MPEYLSEVLTLKKLYRPPLQLQGGRVPRRREPPGLRQESKGSGGHQGRRVGPSVHRVHQPTLEHCVPAIAGAPPGCLGRLSTETVSAASAGQC